MTMPFVTRKPDKHVWKATNTTQVVQENKTASVTWTDVDLTAATSPNAKWAYVKLVLNMDSITGVANATFGVRKNGDTPGDYPILRAGSNHGDVAGAGFDLCQWVEMDGGQVIEWEIAVSGTIQIDCYLLTLAYIE